MRLLSVNTGTARPLRIGGRNILTAIGKTSVAGPVAVGLLGLQGDEQADLSVHGGLDKAVYAYPVEHLAHWKEQRPHAPPLRGSLPPEGTDLARERPFAAVGGPHAPPLGGSLPFGFVGENLSLEGLLEHQVWIGDELVFPGCVLRVTAPREPCFKFNAVTGLPDAGRRMVERACSGWYLAVAAPGLIEAGQSFTLHPGPRGLSVADAFLAKRLKHQR